MREPVESTSLLIYTGKEGGHGAYILPKCPLFSVLSHHLTS